MKSPKYRLSHPKRTELAREMLTVARVYGASKGWALSTVGKHVEVRAGFFQLIEDALLREKTCEMPDFKVSTYDTVMLFFSMIWQDDMVWPEGIKRPKL